MKLPIPDDWDEQTDGYACLFACIPNSPMWRAVYKGLFYQLTWWHVWDKDTGSINGAKAIAQQVFKELCMANCQDIVDQLTRIADAVETQVSQDNHTKAIRQLTAVLGSQTVNLDTPIPAQLDYTQTGIANPLNVLHNRFVMTDSSAWNLYDTKNIVEALETLFRTDSIFDIELRSNIASVMDYSLNIGDTSISDGLKAFVIRVVRKLGLPPSLADLIAERIGLEERISAADLLMVIAMAEGDDETRKSIAKAIGNIQQTINLNNYNGCCDEEDCNCDEAETQTFNLLDLCDQGDTVIDVNGNGQV